MSLSPEATQEFLRATREAATALLDDLHYMRELLQKKDTSSAEIRRLSGVIRRLLIDGDLRKIAVPRIGKIALLAPDNNPIYKSAESKKMMFFMSGRAPIFGAGCGAIFAWIQSAKQPIQVPPDFDDLKTVELRIENFLTQPVLYYRGAWVKRESVIKYVANFASGIHSKTPISEEEKLIARIRHANSLHMKDGGIQIDLAKGHDDEAGPEFRYSPTHIDPTLIEILAAANFVVMSPSVVEIERQIKVELSSLPQP